MYLDGSYTFYVWIDDTIIYMTYPTNNFIHGWKVFRVVISLDFYSVE